MKLANPVHLCFGMLPTDGLQHIVMKVDVEADSFASVQAHCTFPNAVDITHTMDAVVTIAPGATYEYFERHLHGAGGGVLVVPKTRVQLGEGARFKTEFELIKGQAGVIDFDYDADCDAHSILEMVTRIIGRGHDTVTIRETGRLNGEGARAVLNSYLALRDDARAEVYNTLTASAAVRSRSRRLQGDRAGPGDRQGRARRRGQPSSGPHHPRGGDRLGRLQAAPDAHEPRA